MINGIYLKDLKKCIENIIVIIFFPLKDEFYRPMRVAGLLTQDQLSSIFLNVDELTEVNRSFTDSLKDAIEIALDEGDDDLCTVKIGKIFLLSNQPMLEAFKSYCTRQVWFPES